MVAIISRRWVACALVLAAAFPLISAELPQSVVPEGVGVNIHFTRGHEQDLDLIAQAGFKFIRMDFGWAGIESVKGQYDWTAYEELLGNLDKRGVRALFILDYTNPLYEEKVTSRNPITGATHETIASPQHPEGVAAFAKWAGAAAGHFKGRHVIWEIWNEPNIEFWSPKPDASQYATLALAACKEIRKADPNATIIGPATSGFPWEFLETCFKAGLLDYWDAVSVHPYRDYKQSPETAVRDYQRLGELAARYTKPGKPKTVILSGEWGYSTFNKGLPLETQAAFAARQQLANLLNNVPLSIWYDWKNDGPDAAEREHNFGVVTQKLDPKPAYTAIKTLTTELAGFEIKRRLPCESENDFVLLLENADGKQKLAAWTAAVQPRRVSVPFDVPAGSQLRGVYSDGSAFTPESSDGKVRIELKPAPQYISRKP